MSDSRAAVRARRRTGRLCHAIEVDAVAGDAEGEESDDHGGKQAYSDTGGCIGSSAPDRCPATTVGASSSPIGSAPHGPCGRRPRSARARSSSPHGARIRCSGDSSPESRLEPSRPIVGKRAGLLERLPPEGHVRAEWPLRARPGLASGRAEARDRSELEKSIGQPCRARRVGEDRVGRRRHPHRWIRDEGRCDAAGPIATRRGIVVEEGDELACAEAIPRFRARECPGRSSRSYVRFSIRAAYFSTSSSQGGCDAESTTITSAGSSRAASASGSARGRGQLCVHTTTLSRGLGTENLLGRRRALTLRLPMSARRLSPSLLVRARRGYPDRRGEEAGPDPVFGAVAIADSVARDLRYRTGLRRASRSAGAERVEKWPVRLSDRAGAQAEDAVGSDDRPLVVGVVRTGSTSAPVHVLRGQRRGPRLFRQAPCASQARPLPQRAPHRRASRA